MRSRLAALPRTVWILGLISLVNDGASDLIYPLLPLYLTSVLLAGPRALGLIEGIAEASAADQPSQRTAFANRLHQERPLL
jgi:NhaP-type Na+/H+ or K+/H+ antiporter